MISCKTIYCGIICINNMFKKQLCGVIWGASGQVSEFPSPSTLDKSSSKQVFSSTLGGGGNMPQLNAWSLFHPLFGHNSMKSDNPSQGCYTLIHVFSRTSREG